MNDFSSQINKSEIISSDSPFNMRGDQGHEETSNETFYPFPVLKLEKGYYLLERFTSFEALEEMPPLIVITKNDQSLLLEWLKTQVLTDVEKANLVDKLIMLGYEKEFVIESVLPSLNLAPNKAVFRKCLQIMTLKSDVLSYGLQKQISLKQLYFLVQKEEEIVLRLLNLRDVIPLSFSVLMESVDIIQDILKREKSTIQHFLETKSVRDILDSEDSPQDKIRKFRLELKLRKTPSLLNAVSNVHSELKQCESLVRLALEFDQTLEEKGVTLTYKLTSIEDIGKLSDWLINAKNKRSIGNALDAF